MVVMTMQQTATVGIVLAWASAKMTTGNTKKGTINQWESND